jgi:hypothetical protein
MKIYGGVNVKIHVFLTLALVGDEKSALHPSHFIPRERALNTHWVGGWMGPRIGLDDIESRKILPLLRLELQPLGHPAHSQNKN